MQFHYPTRRAALDALSAAALTVGRKWAKFLKGGTTPKTRNRS